MQTEAIVERAKTKNPKALNEIYEMYYPKMVGVYMNIAKEDEDTVHALVHDAFVLAFASLGNLRNNERFGEWLTTIVRNVALKHMAQKGKMRIVPLSDVNHNDASLLDYSTQADSTINYEELLHHTHHAGTPIDTLALIDIADHNSSDIVEKEEHDKPITFGVSFSKTLSERWSIETGIQYSILNSRFTMGEEGYSIVKKQKAHYPGVPLKRSLQLADYKCLSAYSSVGLTVHIPVYGKRESMYIVDWHTHSSACSSFTPPFQWQTSLSVGLQYRYNPHLSIFVEPTFNWFVPSGSEIHTVWTERPAMFTSLMGIRFTW